MDIQVILIIILSILTVNLMVVGVFVVLVLKDLRELVKRGHVVLDNIDSFRHNFSNPLGMFSNVISAVVDGYKAVKSIKDSDSISSLKD